MKEFFNFRSLSAQTIIGFVFVIFLTTAAVGIPAIWLLQNQLDQQAWSQVEQGQRVTISLYATQYREVLGLATLTAQRPTLQEFLIEDDLPALTEYLATLKTGAGLDRIVVCDLDDQIIATTDESLPENICEIWKTGDCYHYNRTIPQACLVAHQNVVSGEVTLGEVFVCIQLNDAFVNELKDETGLEHILWIDDIPVSTSFEGGVDSLQDLPHRKVSMDVRPSQHIFELDGVTYYAAHLPLEESGLNAEVALNVTEIVATRSRLAGILIASIFGISMIGSVIGVILSRRISLPLTQLSESATSFGLGDLDSPIKSESSVQEIAQVAKALESARSDLLGMVTSLQSERDWSKHLLASIVEGIVTLDNEGRITFFSHGAERITGWNRKAVIGKNCNEVFRLVQSDQLFDTVLPEPGGRTKVDVVLAEDHRASLALTRAELAPSDVTDAEIALVFRDISEEEAIHRLLGHFLANVAHEFRTPLSALEASIELLLDQAPNLTQTELSELHTSLHLGVLGLHTLVDNLLESANLEARRFTVSPRTTDLGNIIAEASQTMQPLLKKYGQRLTVELPVDIPVVKIDPRRTVQVLINLISNASKYGPPDEEVTLRVTVDSQWARIAVIDRGSGISLKNRVNIFQRFVFPETENAVSKAGAGLGLSVVKAVVEAQGGQVGVDDHKTGGSIFWFTLPVDKDKP